MDGSLVPGRRARLAATLLMAVGLLPGRSFAQASPAAERRVVDRAERLRQSGRADEARAALEEFLGESPLSTGALAALYDLCAEAGAPAAFLPFAEAADAAARGSDVDPGAARELWVRALIRAGLADSARSVAVRWVGEAPSDERATLAEAAAHLARADTGRAVERLARGAGQDPAWRRVDLLRADLLVARGELEAAAGVWARLLAGDAPATDEVLADLAAAADPQAALVSLVRALDREGAAVGPGAIVAVRRGDPDAARRLAARVRDDGRAEFLREYVREADLADQPGEVAWAATELILLSPRAVDKLRWRAMVADRSLAAGDTTGARAAFEALTVETSPGDGAHDVATRSLFGLLAADPGRLEDARALLERYRREYPDSTREHGAMGGSLAIGHARGGDLQGAESILASERARLDERGWPPLDAAAGRIAFWAGQRDSALVRTGRSLREADLEAAGRTERLRLLSALAAGDSAEVRHAGGIAFGLARDADRLDASGPLRDLEAAPPSSGRPTVLAYVADLAEAAGRSDVAEMLRLRVVEGYPQSPEAPAAILALARASEAGTAREWLERLIVGYPESALAPVARRILTELEGGTPRG